MTESDVPLLVDPAYIRAHPEAVLLDLRWSPKGPPGRTRYLAGHLPGARYIDVETELSAHPKAPGTGRHPLPDLDALAQTLGRLGIGLATHVIAYDDSQLSFAGRAWFLLRAVGFEKVSLLDGGLQAWNGPLETGEPGNVAPVPPPKLQLDRARIATREEIERIARKDSNAMLLDARAAERYRGDVEPLDRVPGHIPGAVNAPFAQNLGPDGRFKSPEELRARFEALGVTPQTDTIAMCGSGITACHNQIALERAGFPTPRLYVGSYSEWSSDPSRPIATGDAPHQGEPGT